MDNGVFSEKLEDYFKGRLSGKDKAEMETLLANDAALRENLVLLKIEDELGSLLLEQQIDAKMQGWAAEKDVAAIAESTKNFATAWRVLWVLLLSITSIIVVSWAIQQQRTNSTTNEKEHIQDALPNDQNEIPASSNDTASVRDTNLPIVNNTQPMPVPMSNNQEIAYLAVQGENPFETIFTRGGRQDHAYIELALAAIKDNKLDTAIQYFSAISMADNEDAYFDAQYYLACLYFKQARFSNAIPILKILLDDGYPSPSTLKWYLALSYLATGNDMSGKALVKDLAYLDKIPPDIQKKAIRLLEKLE